MTAGAALPDGADSYDFYKFQAYVTAKAGNDYYVTATKGEALVSGKSDDAHGKRDIYTNAIELYFGNTAPSEALAGKLLEGAKVEVTMIAKNYHGTIENLLTFADDDITVLEAGEAWKVPEPAVTNKTIAEFKALANSKALAYNVTGKVKSWKNETAAKDKYGNMVLTDGEGNDLTVYGATATATALAWDNASSYAFTNPQDFLTNEQTAALNIGDTVTMKMIRADYNGAIQGTGVITNITPDEGQGGGGGGEEEVQTVVADFSQKLAKHNAYTDTWTYGDFTVAGGANNNGGWAFVKMGGKSATISAAGHPGTWIKTDKAVAYSVESVTIKFVGKCYNQADEKATVKIESYSDAALTTKVAETPAQEVPAITTNDGVEELTFTFAAAQAANSYFKVNFDIVNTTTYNGVVALEKVTFNAASDTPAEIAQPIGTFFATPELTAGGQLPILVQLGDNNAVAVRVNGQDVPNCVIKSYDKSTGEMVITITGMGDASVTYNPETGLLEKLSLLWDKTLLKYDAGVSMYGNEKLKYWNCDGTTEQLQAEWNRRYGNPWTLDTVNADRVTQNTEHYISGSAMRLRPYSGDRFSLATKDFANKFNARNISFWVYNSGEADAKIQSFAYTKTGYSTDGMVQPFGNKTIPAGKWTYVSAGFSAADLYGFQIFVAKTASALIFDDICLF